MKRLTSQLVLTLVVFWFIAGNTAAGPDRSVRPDLLASKKGFRKALIGDQYTIDLNGNPIQNTNKGLLILRNRQQTRTAWILLRHNSTDRENIVMKLAPVSQDLRLTFYNRTENGRKNITAKVISTNGYRAAHPPSADSRFLCVVRPGDKSGRRNRRNLMRLTATIPQTGIKDTVRILTIY